MSGAGAPALRFRPGTSSRQTFRSNWPRTNTSRLPRELIAGESPCAPANASLSGIGEPNADTRHSSDEASDLVENTRYRPSGDHRGRPLDCFVNVNCFSSPRAARSSLTGSINSSDTTLHSRERLNARFRPSAENSGHPSPWPRGGEVSGRLSPLSTERACKAHPPPDEPLSLMASHRPLGCQPIPPDPHADVSASFRSAPPIAGVTKTPSLFGARWRTKAMERPSGDQAGSVSVAGSWVNRSTLSEPINLT